MKKMKIGKNIKIMFLRKYLNRQIKISLLRRKADKRMTKINMK